MGKIREIIQSVTSLIVITVLAVVVTGYLGYDNFLTAEDYKSFVETWFIGTETEPSILENAVDSFIASTSDEPVSEDDSLTLYDYIAIIEKLLTTLSPMVVPYIVYHFKKKAKEENLDVEVEN